MLNEANNYIQKINIIKKDKYLEKTNINNNIKYYCIDFNNEYSLTINKFNPEKNKLYNLWQDRLITRINSFNYNNILPN